MTSTLIRTAPAGASPAKRRILIVDDHPLMRRGLSVLIDHELDLTVCAIATTQPEARAAVARHRPDLLITDISLADDDSLAFVMEIASSRQAFPVLVLSMHDAPAFARRAFRAGARGYVNKQEMSETVLVAIRRVLDGERYLSAKMKAWFDAGLDGTSTRS